MPPKTARPEPSPASALALLAGSGGLLAAMALLTKLSTARIPPAQVVWLRFVVGLAFCAVVFSRRGFRVTNRGGLLLRGLLGSTAALLYFIAIAHLPVGIATLLNQTAPVFTAIWARLILKEELTPGALGALGVTSVGVVLVVLGNGQGAFAAHAVGRWELAGLASAVLSGAAYATIRHVRQTEGPWEIFSAFGAVGLVLVGPIALPSWVAPTGREWVSLTLVGLVSIGYQISMTHAMRFVRAAHAGVVMQLTPVVTLALGWLLLDERVGALSLLGAAVTLAGVTWGVLDANRGR